MYTFWSMPAFGFLVIRGFLISMFPMLKWCFDEDFSLHLLARSERRNCESAIGLRQFWYSTAKYSANSLATFAVVDFLLAIFVCWLVVKFPSPRRYEKVIRRTSICLKTLEKLPDERVTEWWGLMGLYGLGRENLSWRFACKMPSGEIFIRHSLAFSSDSILKCTDMETISMQSIGNIFCASKTAAGWCYDNYVKHEEMRMLCNILLQNCNDSYSISLFIFSIF